MNWSTFHRRCLTVLINLKISYSVAFSGTTGCGDQLSVTFIEPVYRRLAICWVGSKPTALLAPIFKRCAVSDHPDPQQVLRQISNPIRRSGRRLCVRCLRTVQVRLASRGHHGFKLPRRLCASFKRVYKSCTMRSLSLRLPSNTWLMSAILTSVKCCSTTAAKRTQTRSRWEISPSSMRPATSFVCRRAGISPAAKSTRTG